MKKKIFNFFKDTEGKYWSKKYNKWIIPWKRLKFLNRKDEIYELKNYPIVYESIEEIKKEYPNRWLIPISPEIFVKHNNKYLKITELKEFYE